MEKFYIWKYGVLKSKYVEKLSKAPKKENVNSIKYLINRKIDQSELIKLGYALEDVINTVMYNDKKWERLKLKQKKSIQHDYLYINDTCKVILYLELKSNIELDTEKSKSTMKKVFDVHKDLIRKYPDYQIISKLVSLRYPYLNEMPHNVLSKYKSEKIHYPSNSKYDDWIWGYNDLFSYLDYQTYTEDEWKLIINELVNKMFD